MMGVLIGTSEPYIEEAAQLMIAAGFEKEYELHFTIKPDGKAIRKAVSLYDFELILLFSNTLLPDGRSGNLLEQTLHLIQELKTSTKAAVIVATSFRPPGFAMQAEQAGVDGLIDVPFTPEAMKGVITTAFEFHNNRLAAEAEANEARRSKTELRPRVVLLDDSAQVLQIVGSVVWDCWPQATIVACTDSQKAWEELQRTPPDLFITDLSHGGVSGLQLLARLAEQEVRYPIVVLSGNLPKQEAEARAAAGPDLRTSYWAKPINGAEFAEGLKVLL